MLSRETLNAYRRMTPSERLTLALQAMREGQSYLLLGSEEVVRRRFERNPPRERCSQPAHARRTC
jgi:hypothetical protein